MWQAPQWSKKLLTYRYGKYKFHIKIGILPNHTSFTTMQLSIWEKESFYSHKQVIIVGAGLAGLWCALELYNNDNTLQILLLDKGIIPTGASTRNAGFACFGSPTELLYDAKVNGEATMWEIAAMRYHGIEKIKQQFSPAIIDYDNCGGYELLDEGFAGINELTEQLEWLNKGLEDITGEKNVFARNDKLINIFNFNRFKYLIENKLEGGLHSGRLLQALVKKVQCLGIEIITSVSVTGWQSEENAVQVHTSAGILFNCDKLLICSNGFTNTLIKNRSVKPGRGQIIVTSPIDDLPFRGTFHFDEGFYYFRNLGNRVLLGGARNKAFAEEETNELELTQVIQAELERFLSERILPGTHYTIDHRWSGIMAFTETKLPVAEEIEPGVFAMIACNGMGVALTPVMAEKIAWLMYPPTR